MTVLFIRGVPDDCIGELRGIDRQGNVSWNTSGCCDVQEYMQLGTGAATSIMMFGPKIKQSDITIRRKPSLVFNQISEPETHAGSLERSASLCSQLRVPVINHPLKVMRTTRDGVSDMLQNIPGVRMPKTVRVNPRSPGEIFDLAASAQLDFPFIVRIPGFHNGRQMLLIQDRGDHDRLHVFPFDGRDFFLTEFVDCSDDRGLYFKTRLVVIDGVPHVRHSYFNRSWKIHATDAFQYMQQNPSQYTAQEMLDRAETRLVLAREAVRGISERIGLEYYGIDCHIDEDGGLLVFEANANMNVLVSPEPFEHQRVLAIRQQLRNMLMRRMGRPAG